jgi:pimeloyl-ACP methyl ester carboxylesterase
MTHDTAPQTRPQILSTVLKNAPVPGGADCTLAYAEWEPESAARGTVIAVHGLTRQKRDFDYLARALSQGGWRVLAVDVPGRGGSSRFADPMLYDLEVYADVFALFLQRLGIAKAHWIGTSMGGLIAMVLAQKGLAGFMQSLTLVDITPVPNAEGLARIAGYVTETLPYFDSRAQYAALLKLNLPLGDVPEDVWDHYARHQLVETDKGLTFHFDPLIARAAKPAFEKGVDLSEGMAKIACPVALVAGSVSDLCTKKEIADLQKTRPGTPVHIREGAGHVPALEDAATQQFILRFIEGIK